MTAENPRAPKAMIQIHSPSMTPRHVERHEYIVDVAPLRPTDHPSFEPLPMRGTCDGL